MTDINGFEWTDELVKDFLNFNAKVNGLNPTFEEFKIRKLKELKEKDIPKDKRDWEVISIKGKESGKIYKLYNGTWLDNMSCGFPHDCSKGMEGSGCEIHSIKRLMDSEIFTIGDKVKYNGEKCNYDYYIIDNFFITKNNEMLLRSGKEHTSTCEFIGYVDKAKPKVPLFTFTTFDNVVINDPDKKLFGISKGCDCYNVQTAETIVAMKLYGIYNWFYDKEKRNEWVVENKVMPISYKELISEFNDESHVYSGVSSIIKAFFKKKINS